MVTELSCPVLHFMTLSRHLGFHSLALLHFHAKLWLILNLNMSKLLGKRGTASTAHMEEGKYCLKSYDRTKT